LDNFSLGVGRNAVFTVAQNDLFPEGLAVDGGIQGFVACCRESRVLARTEACKTKNEKERAIKGRLSRPEGPQSAA
jgi:hypothetical protein